MTKILAAMTPDEASLGPPHIDLVGDVQHVYVDRQTGEELAVLIQVVGMLPAYKFDVLPQLFTEVDVKVLMLSCREESSATMRKMYIDQGSFLEQVVARESTDNTRIITHRQHWTHVATDAANGIVFVRLPVGTFIDNTGFSGVDQAMLAKISKEIPEVRREQPDLEVGALMVLNVVLGRLDTKRQQVKTASGTQTYGRPGEASSDAHGVRRKNGKNGLFKADFLIAVASPLLKVDGSQYPVGALALVVAAVDRAFYDVLNNGPSKFGQDKAGPAVAGYAADAATSDAPDVSLDGLPGVVETPSSLLSYIPTVPHRIPGPVPYRISRPARPPYPAGTYIIPIRPLSSRRPKISRN
ncbi:hypothetical protein DFH06DRAFT_1144200 [Mycena polygramma]|nr:hypothetical protein DFH06DRAFT_1144200 [Mycena polygramma]